MNHEASMVNLVDNDEMDDDEVEVNMPMGPPSKHQRMPSSSGSGSSINSTTKGPMNLYFSKPSEKRKGGPIDLESSRKILRDLFGKAVKVHAYINQRALLLNMMRRYTKQRNLVKPAKTRLQQLFDFV
ncbi:hypothetical protein H5410_014638 [Solanum commersonii]|uniref:Uncharacterized protein n=1 Tax=Solanum commersonii TaxID=4109 RepID=A0A9J5ZRI2_SOLCO|nr:hypothetical protein H5410_014638 [Solanum commersonii]